MSQSQIKIYDEAALLERLTIGIQKSGQGAIFLVGSALTAPDRKNAPGVPNVQGLIDLIRQEFSKDQQVEFEKEIGMAAIPIGIFLFNRETRADRSE